MITLADNVSRIQKIGWSLPTQYKRSEVPAGLGIRGVKILCRSLCDLIGQTSHKLRVVSKLAELKMFMTGGPRLHVVEVLNRGWWKERNKNKLGGCVPFEPVQCIRETE